MISTLSLLSTIPRYICTYKVSGDTSSSTGGVSAPIKVSRFAIAKKRIPPPRAAVIAPVNAPVFFEAKEAKLLAIGPVVE
jgi:hypothetical protein